MMILYRSPTPNASAQDALAFDDRIDAFASDAFALDEVLDLKAARPLADALLVRRGLDLEVDASNVRRLGGLCLQVLLSAFATWTQDGKSLVFLNPAPAFLEGLERLGVAYAA